MIPRPSVSASAASLLVGALLLAGAPVASAAGHLPSGAAEPARTARPGVYLVTLDAPPAGAYAGGVPGLRPTRPTDGQRFDRTRPAVRAYSRWLLHRQDRVLAGVGRPDVLYRYTTAVDGFAASLTGRQVRLLRGSAGVLRVERSTKQHIDRTPTATAVTAGRSRPLLGLTGARGAWAGHGGPASAGRGIVVGVVDSGIWPENPSFADPGPDPSLPGFHGTCQTGERWRPADCTAKIVSARWFVRGFGAANTATAEFLSPRDGTGHGSHVASTAGGQDGVRVRIDGQRFGITSGMAPAARLAVYKACWTAPEPADDGCTSADTVAAVDRAVGDGVDVLNYSVSGSEVRDDTVERAFLGAATAGVFVATSAGNDARAGSVEHVAPWVTTVAASTYGLLEGTVRLGDGTSYVGAMAADRSVAARPVLGGAIPARGHPVAAARRCSDGSLDASKAEGRVVVCERGGSPRVDKSTAVADAGGVGMVLVDTGSGGVDADVHAVPTVHLDARAGGAVTAYVRRAGRRATVTLAPRSGHAAAERATFSARGPAAASGGDVLKPDLTAPGVSVLGAVAPPSDSGRSWDLVSGTSTSAPHVAGLAAFVAGVHPHWSPARIKSAMMTTAYDLAGRHGPLLEGAGHIDPTRLLDPGLVLDTDPSVWQRLAAGTVAARDVNAASVAVGDLVGPTTVRRRVTNVTDRRESYAARIEGMPGVDVQAFPASIRLAPGATRTVRLRITARPSATVDRDVTGWLVWRGARHLVRIPLSVRPTVVTAPQQVDGAGDRGTVVVRGRSGNGRTVKLRSTGLVPARTSPVRLQPRKPDRRRAPADTDVRTIPVPPGTDVARFAVASGDADLYVYRDGRLVASSTTSPAEVTLTQPAPGDYRVYVAANGTRTGPSDGVLQTWVVPQKGGSAVALSTDAVGFAPGRRFRYSASWKDLKPGKHYLGVVSYGDSGRHTLVEVNRP